MEEKKLDEILKVLNGMQGQINGLQGQMVDMQNGLQGQINGLQGQMVDMQNGLQGQINGLQGQINGLETKISNLEDKMDHKFEEVNHEIKASERRQNQKLAKLEYIYGEKISAIFDKVTSMEEILIKTRADGISNENRIKEHDDTLFQHDYRISKLENLV